MSQELTLSIQESSQDINLIIEQQSQNIDLIINRLTVVPGDSHTVANSQIFELSADDIFKKYITVTEPIIDNQSVLVFIEGSGILSEVGYDYSVSGQDIFWTSYAFENILTVGDKLRVIFN